MEPSTDITEAALNAAAETGRALLDAMDAEEPFRLLSTIPGKLQELCTVGGRLESTVEQLVEDVAHTQLKNQDSISSGVHRIREWREEVRSLLDHRVHQIQREADDIQELLEELHNNRRTDTLPRRSRAQEKFSCDLSNELSKLQDTSERIQEVSRYICDVAEGLAIEKQTIYSLIHRIAREMGLAQGECGICERDNHPSATIDVTDPEPYETMSNRMQDMEKRCEDVERAVFHNNEVIARQVQEIGRLRGLVFYQ